MDEAWKAVVRKVAVTDEEALELPSDKSVMMKSSILLLGRVQSDLAMSITQNKKWFQELKEAIVLQRAASDDTMKRIQKLENAFQDLVNFLDPKLTMETYRQSYAVAIALGSKFTPSNIHLELGMKRLVPGIPCVNDIIIKKLQHQGVEMRRELILGLTSENYSYNSFNSKFVQYMKISSSFDSEVLKQLQIMIFISVACYFERPNRSNFDPVREELFHFFGINFQGDTEQQLALARTKILGKTPIERADYVLKRGTPALLEKLQRICHSCSSFFDTPLMSMEVFNNLAAPQIEQLDTYVPEDIFGNRAASSSAGSHSNLELGSNINSTPIRHDMRQPSNAHNLGGSLNNTSSPSMRLSESHSLNESPISTAAARPSDVVTGKDVDQLMANMEESRELTGTRRQREEDALLDQDNQSNEDDEDGVSAALIEKTRTTQKKVNKKRSSTAKRTRKT